MTIKSVTLCAESNKKSFNPNDAKEIKLEVTDNDGRVVVKEVRGEEMACIMKCFPAKEKRCRTKSTPDDETILSTTPTPLEPYEDLDETTDMTTAAKMSTVSFRSGSSSTKKEQAVSAETATEVSDSSKKEIQENEENEGAEGDGRYDIFTTLTKLPTLITTNRTPSTGSIANNQPQSPKFEPVPDISTNEAQQVDPYSDYNIIPTPSDLDSLDLVTSMEVDKLRSYRTRPPKRKSKSSKRPTSRKKSSVPGSICEGDELCEIESVASDTKRRHEEQLPQNLHFTIIKKTDESSTSTLKSLEIESTTIKLTKHSSNTDTDSSMDLGNHSFRRHSHEDYDIECDSIEHDSVEIFVSSTERTTDLIENSSTFDIAIGISDNSKIPLESNSHTLISTEEPIETEIPVQISTVKPFEIPTEKHLETSNEKSLDPSTDTNNISFRRMSESEEFFTECDSVEEQLFRLSTSTTTPFPSTTKRPIKATTILEYKLTTSASLSSVHQTTSTPEETKSTNPNINRTVNTESMRRMSESEEVVTDCETDEDKTFTTIAQTTPTTIQTTQSDLPIYTTPIPTATTFLTTLGQESTTINELSRRMSESTEDCDDENAKSTQKPQLSTKKDQSSTEASSLSQSLDYPMRRMSESDENTTECDSHENSIVHSTEAPSMSDEMRRMSHIDIVTTKPNFEDLTNPTNLGVAYDDLTEYVTECDTDRPLVTETVVESSQEPQNEVKNTTEKGEIDDIQCCPDAVCLMVYPKLSKCDVSRTNMHVVDFFNFTRKIEELRDMFYLYKTQVLITKMLGDSDYIEKRNYYKQYLVGLWNETLLNYQIDNGDNCANSSGNEKAKETISSIYCFLNKTNNLLNERFLNMILEVVKSVETTFPNKKIVKYPKLRRIILQSLPKAVDEIDAVHSLSDYMKENRNHEKERIFLLQLLLDIQERFERKMKNNFNFIELQETTDNQIIKEVTDSPDYLQENGLGIKMRRTPK